MGRVEPARTAFGGIATQFPPPQVHACLHMFLALNPE